jgi:AhpD family alkylhydroperoxidase
MTARIALVHDDEKPGLFARLAFWFARRRFHGKVPAPLRALVHNGRVLAAVGGFELAIEGAKAVDEPTKLLVSLRVAQLVGCHFCLDIGTALGRGAGIEEAQLVELADYETSSAFDERLRVALGLATAMTVTPPCATDELFALAREHFDEAALVELCSMIAWENYRARFNHTLDLPPDGFTEGSYCVMAARLPAVAMH